MSVSCTVLTIIFLVLGLVQHLSCVATVLAGSAWLLFCLLVILLLVWPELPLTLLCIPTLPFSSLFPTCQVRVVRFYHSCSPPPPRLAILLLLLLRQHLLHHLCLHFHCCLANSLPSSSPTSELSVHRWTSTWDLPSSVGTAGPQPWDLPSSVGTAGPQPGTCPLSVHRWTSTWDLPSSVCTAGPQPGTCPAQCAPLDLNGQIECQKICQIECQIEFQKICQVECQKICQIECQKICQIKCQKICQIECQKICQ